ncbi:unnamed protein product [Rotaria sp. Silwood1]|nr:unnamed protein product [Rotaria sp. Silwood1]
MESNIIEPPTRPMVIFTSSETKQIHTAYTRHQLSELEKQFNFCKYVPRQRCIQIANSLLLTERRLKWNHDCHLSKTKSALSNTCPSVTTSSSGLTEEEDIHPTIMNNSIKEEPCSSASSN